MRKVFETGSDKISPIDFIIKTLKKHFGCAMGTCYASNLVDIFISLIDEEVMKKAESTIHPSIKFSFQHTNQPVIF